ncbi:hydrogenase expression/formation protein [Betaproteobacteria bacterium SCN1]|jgi:hydrogenase-1 operon protein HyaF|nr:hydrogenase expression/formation protein [Betaproteobacteria bacterium SCN1]
MSLETIPIHAVPPAAGLSGNAPPLLHELHAMLRRLLDTGASSSIDLSALPLTPADLDWLRDKLGSGEIAVTLQANGESTLDETQCSGIWWVTHRNPQGAVVAQFIEVAFVPELLQAQPQDVEIGLDYLDSIRADL